MSDQAMIQLIAACGRAQARMNAVEHELSYAQHEFNCAERTLKMAQTSLQSYVQELIRAAANVDYVTEAKAVRAQKKAKGKPA